MKFYTDLGINPCIFNKRRLSQEAQAKPFFFVYDTISSIKFNELWSVVIDFFRIA